VEKSGEFKIGDRVAGMHTMLSPGGTYAEFAVLQGCTTTRIPKGLGFEGLCCGFCLAC
jgi:NADPH2:quinone reductase